VKPETPRVQRDFGNAASPNQPKFAKGKTSRARQIRKEMEEWRRKNPGDDSERER
jgi:hypothetical protein